ncbi:hypothetical protein GLOTRDRAFT_141447 [Gloeophyllum trabeum ATCC 11539]|uniref:Fungal-type protein kinase domain-containing protein n=1 Tax=Gloeophyllum trabeum (strain ATCC 11539 / FP-39264 / Madison 617) TaxID=670483 RepID=S7PS92_GLOTA|nr:uncharacterized protein GLOTRDRAFT_141447 [Gloeophyllum trabeum ATCC 11539]EPQ50681.1 hypothetical protein GLOTRDRAFT_141447 [Gloeophyllum trabeum ATCC 11539]
MSSSKESSSPHKPKPAGHHPFSASIPNAHKKRRYNVLAMTDRYAGPMDPETFCDEFLPVSGEQRPTAVAAFNDMKKCETETDMYKAFIACVKAARFCRDYEFVATATTKDPNDPNKRGYQIVDMGLYHKDHAPEPGPNGGLPASRWDRIALFAEFKTQANSKSADPFEDGDTKQRREVRGQLIGYAAEIFARQHRTHVFSLLILGEYARFVRWDRSGAVFSDKIHYAQKPKQISEFIWRFVCATPQEQGYDESAEEIKKDSLEYKAMMDAHKYTDVPYVADYFKKTCDSDWPWYKLRVDVEPSPFPTDAPHPETSADDPRLPTRGSPTTEPRYFLVGKPHTPTAGLTGRATRGYIAWDLTGRRLVFLKDCWRVDSPRLEKEGHTLLKLKEAKVQRTPTLEREGVVKAMKPHVHYRLVVEEIGCRLDDFADSRELVLVIYECLYAHAMAFKQAKILHRDVSAGNILIMRKEVNGVIYSSGLLNDWDLSKNVDIKEVRQVDRTGTWQFMSARLLLHPSKVHMVQDDLESFLHVLVYEAARWLSRQGRTSLDEFMHSFFDEVEPMDNETIGGVHKAHCFFTGALGFTFKCEQLQHIITTLFGWFKAYYNLHEDRSQIPEKVANPSFSLSEGHSRPPQPLDLVPEGSYLPAKEAQPLDPKVAKQAYAEVAEYLQDHNHMIALFAGQLRLPDWPQNDRLPELQVDPYYQPDPLGLESTSRRSSKRSASQLTGLDTDVSEERRAKASRSRG